MLCGKENAFLVLKKLEDLDGGLSLRLLHLANESGQFFRGRLNYFESHGDLQVVMNGRVDPVTRLGLKGFIGVIGVSGNNFVMDGLESAHLLMNQL